MLMNNLDPDVAERPDELVVYGGTGRAARSWEAFDAIVRSLRALEDDETLLVQSGKPVGVMRTHEWAPRVLIANSNLVPEWATWEEFRRLEDLGLTMYGQMTAGSWIYIGTQGIVQGTFECFAEIARRNHGGSLAGTITLTAGPRRHGRRAAAGGDDERRRRAVRRGRRAPHPAAAGDALPRRAGRRPRRRGRALPRREGGRARAQRRAARQRGRGAAGAARRRASRPTSSPTRRARTTRSAATSPTASVAEEAERMRTEDPEEYVRRSRAAMAAHCAAMVGFKDRGAEVFDYGNSLRAEAKLGGFERAFDYPGFVPAYVRPLFCEGKGPFRWVALSGDPADIAATDRAVLEEFPDDELLARWISEAGEKIAFQGLPARICWLGYGERRRLGLRFNEMVRSGELSAPIVIGRDHLDSGSVASPYRETEGMADESDAIADWPLLNALVNTSSGASWVIDPPRRRRRHRPLDPRRHGVRRRRHRPRRRRSSSAC